MNLTECSIFLKHKECRQYSVQNLEQNVRNDFRRFDITMKMLLFITVYTYLTIFL